MTRVYISKIVGHIEKDEDAIRQMDRRVDRRERGRVNPTEPWDPASRDEDSDIADDLDEIDHVGVEKRTYPEFSLPFKPRE